MSESKSSKGRVSLRPLKSDDAEAFMSWGGDQVVAQSLFWDAYEDLESAKVFLAKVVDPHPWFKAIVYDGQVVVAITLDRGNHRASQRAELGYVLARSAWGKGIATEAVLLALASGFKDLNVVRIEAYVDPENQGSVRVLEKAQMIQEGYLRNYVVHRGQIRDRKLFAICQKPE